MFMSNFNLMSKIAPKQLPLSVYERKITPTNGIVEEGLLEHIFSVIQPKNKFCVEFGAGDGTNYSFTRNLIEQHGYSALLIEADEKLSTALTEKYASLPKVKTIRSFLSRENIVSLFQSAEVPAEPALICIDIDGNDYYMWQALSEYYRPDVLCIEFNSSFGPDREFVIPYREDFSWNGDDFFGASMKTMVDLGSKLGYALIHSTSAGDNLIFVRNDHAHLFSNPKLSAREMYQLPQYGKNGRALNGKGHPASPHTTSLMERLWYRMRYQLMAIPRKVVYAKLDPKGHRK